MRARGGPRTVVGQQHESVSALHDVGILGVEVRLPQVAPVDVPHHHPLLERVPRLPAPATAARLRPPHRNPSCRL